MNKKSDIFTFDKNVTTTFINEKNEVKLQQDKSKIKIKNISLKENDKVKKDNKKINIIEEIISEDPFFFF